MGCTPPYLAPRLPTALWLTVIPRARQPPLLPGCTIRGVTPELTLGPTRLTSGSVLSIPPAVIRTLMESRKSVCRGSVSRGPVRLSNRPYSLPESCSPTSSPKCDRIGPDRPGCGSGELGETECPTVLVCPEPWRVRVG